MTKRIIALICALFVLLPAVVSCATTNDPAISGDGEQTQAPGGNSATTNAPAATEEEETSSPTFLQIATRTLSMRLARFCPPR